MLLVGGNLWIFPLGGVPSYVLRVLLWIALRIAVKAHLTFVLSYDINGCDLTSLISIHVLSLFSFQLVIYSRYSGKARGLQSCFLCLFDVRMLIKMCIASFSFSLLCLGCRLFIVWAPNLLKLGRRGFKIIITNFSGATCVEGAVKIYFTNRNSSTWWRTCSLLVILADCNMIFTIWFNWAFLPSL